MLSSKYKNVFYLNVVCNDGRMRKGSYVLSTVMIFTCAQFTYTLLFSILDLRIRKTVSLS